MEEQYILENTIYQVLHGSRAYGTHTPTSDYDEKGVCIIPDECYYFGFKNFENKVDNWKDGKDRQIFGIKKFINLALTCNPNIIEILYVDESDIIHINALGEQLRHHRDIFLSKFASRTFVGYAVSQLQRIEGHYKWLTNPPQKPNPDGYHHQHKLAINSKTYEREFDSHEFSVSAPNLSSITLYCTERDQDLIEGMRQQPYPYSIIPMSGVPEVTIGVARFMGKEEIFNLITNLQFVSTFIDKKFKVHHFDKGGLKSANKKYKQYCDWLKNRNPARAKLEAAYGYDSKHAYHLIRLLRMSKEILSTGKVYVKRPDAAELLEIRNGKYSYEELLVQANTLKNEINELVETSALPNQPNYMAAEKLQINLIKAALNK